MENGVSDQLNGKFDVAQGAAETNRNQGEN
jgi:hypothetical protein